LFASYAPAPPTRDIIVKFTSDSYFQGRGFFLRFNVTPKIADGEWGGPGRLADSPGTSPAYGVSDPARACQDRNMDLSNAAIKRGWWSNAYTKIVNGYSGEDNSFLCPAVLLFMYMEVCFRAR
jgi:hypothetical protein